MIFNTNMFEIWDKNLPFEIFYNDQIFTFFSLLAFFFRLMRSVKKAVSHYSPKASLNYITTLHYLGLNHSPRRKSSLWTWGNLARSSLSSCSLLSVIKYDGGQNWSTSSRAISAARRHEWQEHSRQFENSRGGKEKCILKLQQENGTIAGKSFTHTHWGTPGDDLTPPRPTHTSPHPTWTLQGKMTAQRHFLSFFLPFRLAEEWEQLEEMGDNSANLLCRLFDVCQ